MGVIFIQVAIGVAFGIFVIRFITRWAAYNIVAQVEKKFRAVDTLVNQESIPEQWLHSYHLKIERLRKSGVAEKQIERVGLQAHADCLDRIQELKRFFDRGTFFDSLESQRETRHLLEAQHQRWLTTPWQELFGTQIKENDPARH